MKKIYSPTYSTVLIEFLQLISSIKPFLGTKLKYGLLSLLAFWITYNSTLHAQLPDSLKNKFQQVNLLTGLKNATTMKFAPDGRIFILDRYGEVLIYKTDTQTALSAGTIPVFHELEDGLLGLAFDPDFLNNDFVYIYYSPSGLNANRVSRFKMDGDDLNQLSEVVMLEWETSRTAKFHSGGGLDFDSQGNLYIATGDNTGYDNPYAAWNETESDHSAEKSSSNTNDLRGKILRIKPQPDGTYTIPSGNLFPEGTPLTKPEIYVMGARNPYRIFVDKTNTDWLFWGEVGPDANEANALGPEGLDEMNLTKSAGNYGWPYFSGDNNQAYQIPYRTPSPYYNDPAAPENTSVWNTGATVLPPAQPAWIEFFHKSYFAGPRYYHDANLTDEQRFPEELDEAFFYYDFNTSKIWTVTMDAQGNILTDEPFAPSIFPTTADGFIDMAFGPDGKMYILAYGAGCCPQNVGSGKLIRVDYTGITTNAPPNVRISADTNNGSLPLTVNFSSAGTTDPDGDSPLIFSWDVNGDGNTDYTVENPTHTYLVEGTYNVQLKVDDGNGGIGVNNITIYAGNNAAEFTFNSPPDGGLMNWQDDIQVDLLVTDEEDGTIDCNNVNLVPSLGHLNHFHDEETLNGCPKSITLDVGTGHGADGDTDIFYVLNTNYTDSGGLQAFDQIVLHPKRKEAEFFDTQENTRIIPNTDPLEGGFEAIEVDNNGYISFSGRNLQNIDAVKYKVAAAQAGGTIELRQGSPTGILLATTNVPATGGLDSWVSVQSPISDPGGKNDLFFVFKHPSATTDIFNLNYVEFMGAGVSIDNSPPLVGSVTAVGASQVKVVFTEYVTQATAEQLSNYSVDNGITISSAVLQTDGRTVLLAVSTLSSDVVYNLQISNVENTSGLPIATDSYQFSTISSTRINVGGNEGSFNYGDFIADKFFGGGQLYSITAPIAGTNDDALYQTERYGNFTYEVPVPVAGEYDIRLHFAELFFGVGGQSGGPGSRIFNVSIEGVSVLNNFDILAETDPATALQKEFNNISITDGIANIQFTSVVNSAKVAAIEILPPDTFSVEPKITILSPEFGWSVNQTFDIHFSVENWKVKEGDTHMHYYIDGNLVAPHYSYEPLTIENLNLGSHTIRLELFDANHVPTGIYDEIMVSVTDQGVCNSTIFPDAWAVHQLETHSHTAVFTIPHFDLDGDGLKDIVTGGWWYKNPGAASGNWEKKTIGGNFGNVVHVYDFDGDGHMDLLGTEIGPPGSEYQSERLLWAKNDGNGNFTVYNNIPVVNTGYGEPFLAGITGGDFGLGSPYQMAINWNGAESTNFPVQMLTPTADPTTGTWTLEAISNDPSGEDIEVGDIDGDGRLDLYQGINWLRNEGDGTWTTYPINVGYATTPDRIQLADFNGNGRLDGVVGQLGLGTDPDRMQLAWFESPADPTQPWTKHIISNSVNGSLSLFAIDFDFDGDMDIVVGEWNGSKRLIAFENDLCNSGQWIEHILDDGSLNLEHHDSAMVVDIDNDGDLDVVSNGWLNNKGPRIYENTTLSPQQQDPVADAGEDQVVLLPTTSVTLNGTGSDPNGGTVTFLWNQVSGPNTATLSGENTTNLSVTDMVEGVYVFRLTVTNNRNNSVYDEVSVSVEEEVLAIRINSGGPAYTFNIVEWAADQSFTGGTTFSNNIAIANTSNDKLYQTERYASSGTLVYDIPVNDGTYDLNLHFAEIFHGVPGQGSAGGEGSRVFNIEVENGQVQIDNYDIVAAAGGSATAVIEHYENITVNDGSLTITLTSVVDFPKISGIEVLKSGGTSELPIVSAGKDKSLTLPTNSIVLDGSAYDPDGGAIVSYLWTQESGPNMATLSNETTDNLTVNDLVEGTYVFRLTVTDDEDDSAWDEMVLTVLSDPVPFRINSGGPDFDFNGELWSSDQFFSGGGLHSNVIPIANTENDTLYQTERFITSGNLIYEIPVDNGKHNVSLHFAEIYFGVPNGDPNGGVGSRVFHIDVENGAQRIENYDIVVEAGGSATAVIETFSNIEVQDGNLTITLIPVTQFPKISGIEVTGSRVPEVDAGPDQAIDLPENTIIQNGSGRDPDGGAVTYLWTQMSGPGTAILMGEDTPELTASDLIVGTYVFRLTVTDDETDSSWDEVTITVNPNPNNEPPTAVATANPMSGTVPLTVSFTGSNSTDDVQVTGYEWNFMDGSPLSTEADPVHEFTAVGIYSVELTVTDGTLTNTTTVDIMVNAATGNEAPIITNPGTQTDLEGDEVALQIEANDPNGDILTYTATDLPSGLTINASTGLINGTIDVGASSNSPYNVTLTVIDDGSPTESTSISFTWNVDPAPVNQAPEVTNPGDKTNEEGEVISLDIDASDSEGDVLTYTAVNLPNGLSIDPVIGRISGTIADGSADNSPYSVEVTVTDDGTPIESTTISFTWNVEPLVINMPPEITNPGTQDNVEGDVVSLQINASDPDGDNVTYGAANLPNGLFIDSQTGLISGTIADGTAANSPYSVEVTITDDGSPAESTTISFTWNVSEFISNQPPMAVVEADEIMGTAPLTVTFTGSNSTDDIEIISYLWDFQDGGSSDEANPVYVFEQPGVYRVSLTVSDGSLTDTAFITITVTSEEEEEKISALIAPNPSNDTAKVFLLNVPIDDEVKVIYLHDAAGKFINSMVDPQMTDDHYAVPIATLRDGVYYITLVMGSDKVLPIRLLVKN